MSPRIIINPATLTNKAARDLMQRYLSSGSLARMMEQALMTRRTLMTGMHNEVVDAIRFSANDLHNSGLLSVIR